jgi:hypothetical protein
MKKEDIQKQINNMERDEMKCLSCDKVIKVRNLKRHSKAKLHLKSVEKKVNVMKQNITTKKQIKMKKQTAVEKLELMLLGMVSFDSEELRLKYKKAFEKAKEMEKQQIVDNSKNNWISVNDRLPDESGRYLGYLTELKCLGNSYSTINVAFNTNHKDSTAWTEHGEVLQYITHWMPLPNPPKDR